MSNVYSILDLDGYADAVRNEAASSYASNYTENIEEFITLEQTKSLVESYSLGTDDDGYNVIDTDTHFDILEDISKWIFNVGLAKLAASNKLECAWDDSVNDMVFWSPDNTGKQTNDSTTNTIPKTRDRSN